MVLQNAFENLATEAKQDSVLTSLANLLTELQQKYEGGAIALDAATLAALETVSVANFPADYPDAAVLAKVEAVRALLAAGIVVSATGLDIRALALATDNVRQTQRPMSSYIATQSSASGIVTAQAAGPTERIRILRLDGGSKPNNTADTFCTVTIKTGATTQFSKTLQVGEPIGGQVCLEGAAGDDLTVEVTGTGSVEFNLRYEVFT